MEFDNVEHLLPAMAQLIAHLIGLPKTLQLIEAYGGTTFPVSKCSAPLGRIRYEALAEVVGVEAANALTDHFGGDVLAIPKCAAAMRELRDRRLRTQFDRLTRKMGSTYAATELARSFCLTERQVWRILKQSDVVEETRRVLLPHADAGS